MSKPSITKQIVRVELACCRDIYKANDIANSQLFNLVMESMKKAYKPFNTAWWKDCN